MAKQKTRGVHAFANARITAGELHAGHIGEIIRWMEFHRGKEVITVRTAELRQINHNGNETTVTYGYGANDDTTLQHDHPVILGPPEDYTDHAMFSAIPDDDPT